MSTKDHLANSDSLNDAYKSVRNTHRLLVLVCVGTLLIIGQIRTSHLASTIGPALDDLLYCIEEHNRSSPRARLNAAVEVLRRDLAEADVEVRLGSLTNGTDVATGSGPFEPTTTHTTHTTHYIALRFKQPFSDLAESRLEALRDNHGPVASLETWYVRAFVADVSLRHTDFVYDSSYVWGETAEHVVCIKNLSPFLQHTAHIISGPFDDDLHRLFETRIAHDIAHVLRNGDSFTLKPILLPDNNLLDIQEPEVVSHEYFLVSSKDDINEQRAVHIVHMNTALMIDLTSYLVKIAGTSDRKQDGISVLNYVTPSQYSSLGVEGKMSLHETDERIESRFNDEKYSALKLVGLEIDIYHVGVAFPIAVVAFASILIIYIRYINGIAGGPLDSPPSLILMQSSLAKGATVITTLLLPMLTVMYLYTALNLPNLAPSRIHSVATMLLALAAVQATIMLHIVIRAHTDRWSESVSAA